jgi:hypothetical protein
VLSTRILPLGSKVIFPNSKSHGYLPKLTSKYQWAWRFGLAQLRCYQVRGGGRLDMKALTLPNVSSFVLWFMLLKTYFFFLNSFHVDLLFLLLPDPEASYILIFIGHFTPHIEFLATKSLIYFHLLLETSYIIYSRLNLTNICHIKISKKFNYFCGNINYYGTKIIVLFDSYFKFHI